MQWFTDRASLHRHAVHVTQHAGMTMEQESMDTDIAIHIITHSTTCKEYYCTLWSKHW